MSKVVLITGTSSGIGLAAAVAAARAGFTTVATLRNPQRADALRKAAEEAGVELDIRPLDVTDAASVADCVAGVVADHGRLDAVVNNAGAGHLGTLEGESLDDVRAVMEVNFFGVVQVSKAALPHLRATGGRLITVSSVGGVIGQPFNEAYCAAKFAVEGFMESLAPVAASVGVTVSVVEPGAVASEFVSNVGVDLPAALVAAGPYAPAMEAYLARTQAQFASFAQPPAGAAETILEVLTADRPAFRLQTSDAARGFVGAKLADLDGSAVQALTSGWIA
ncbi:NAD(P)-dependent dehydrogenase (short-subunit alcohol dehydrogenase family) [Kitasatospora sp. MAP12-15]|uniref:SDR family NAD(P)-dependent oxidoreductase n=1 Tax=unclassified Kitasatospora TaxID=2633591 RepID=UPI002474593F|nr:SDR family NAD(P)-dependent oxidoreductase [Kitasatospora sp. MAP12-44]MDH6114797.1 NAD(P)-dependent dehydrogenase (short-subunit alcohol dehydrogenase family) [Kitasatospora sp. MAP12-44]